MATIAADMKPIPAAAPAVDHLDRLEAESLHVLREVAAECRRPVLLYSIGKDSSVLLHLLLKAFAPAPPPIPLLHVDTTWKFREMIAFRDRRAAETGVELRVHVNPDGLRDGVGPFTHGASVHTEVMKTLALKQALEAGGVQPVQRPGRRGRERARVPAVELVRAGRVALRAPREHRRGAAVLRRRASGGVARRYLDHGRRRPLRAARGREDRAPARTL